MSIEQLVTAFADGPLAEWLTRASASQELKEAEHKIRALEPIIGRKKTAAALRALTGSSRDARRLREREASEALAAAVRKHGLVLEPRAPLQRRRREVAARPAAPTARPASAAEGDPSSAGGAA